MNRMSTAVKWEMSMFGHTIGILNIMCRMIYAIGDNILRHGQQIIFRRQKFPDLKLSIKLVPCLVVNPIIRRCNSEVGVLHP